jgi:flagellar biogenesis protein FliO
MTTTSTANTTHIVNTPTTTGNPQTGQPTTTIATNEALPWNQTQPVETNPVSDMGRVAFNLVLVLVLAVVIIRWLRPWLMRQKNGVNSSLNPAHRIQVRHGVRLGGGHTLHTVSVGEQTLLVGTGPGGSPQALCQLSGPAHQSVGVQPLTPQQGPLA